MSRNFLGSPFVHQKPIFKPFKNPEFTMSACVHSSRTEAPPQKSNQEIDDHLFDSYVKYYRPNFPDLVPRVPGSRKGSKGFHTQTQTLVDESSESPDEKVDDLWLQMKDEARLDVEQEPILSNYYFSSILSHDSMESALANYLSMKLSNSSLPSGTLYDLFLGVLMEDQEIMRAVTDDLRAVKERDPACISYGFRSPCSGYSPGAKIGRGILFDHATGLVVGETAVIGNNVSILHNVTLGGTGKVSGDRHPKIGNGVLIGAGTCVLGNVRIEDGAKIGAGSVVLKQIPARTTAVGNPARLIGGKENPVKLDKIPSLTMDHTSHISEWSDYVI
ncbi:Serine acetyltransferase 3, mitochondrial [Sesamum angolense]|uniref:serine O-acetyltransferase n=1 Tax=Sesamum angolense TaxID=2727404 RepID=A0AAE1WSL5_9LAMI|nr:Serine acetyltransferase 3, mitochondrial [Sesamum angolense]